MKILIVSGMSGAGKSSVANVLEDLNYYCVDNMPIELMEKFIDICLASQDKMNKVAIVTDVRSGDKIQLIAEEIEKIKKHSSLIEIEILFIDSSDETIIKRYKETRRKHPLEQGSLVEAIYEERQLLAPVKESATYNIDTSRLSSRELKEQIFELFANGKKSINIRVVSFGFKYGILNEADLVFDVRCLPNPFYIEELKELNGLDSRIKDYVLKSKLSEIYIDKIVDLVETFLPSFVEEGKNTLVIGIGCTGGRHRSVVLCEEIANKLLQAGHLVTSSHRDMHVAAKLIL